ncbi:MAG: LysM peptidoglycan-binding domain-containing protein, partial [Muribaculaceae bacterium]|nr:LysM peptidoglycan-binding domain-containing protein [Muribaculaceae bacterium]
SKIAKKYGVTINSIKKANGNIKTLKRGQTIKVVIVERTPKPREIDVTEATADGSMTADSIHGIEACADSLGVNHIETDSIMLAAANAARSENAGTENTAQTEPTIADRPEPEVVKPTPAPAPKKKSNEPVYHTVRKGESPAKIAKKYNTTTAKILKLNNLTSSSKIHPGDKLRVR